MLAIASGQVEVARALLEAGANVRVRDNFGHSAMWEAVHSERTDLIELLTQFGEPWGGEGARGRGSLEPRPGARWSPGVVVLHTCLQQHRPPSPASALLSSSGAEPAACLSSTRAGGKLLMNEVELASCMCQAVSQRNHTVLAMYMKAGADPLSRNYDERTPLHVAAAEGNLEALRLMVEETHCKIDPLDRWAARCQSRLQAWRAAPAPGCRPSGSSTRGAPVASCSCRHAATSLGATATAIPGAERGTRPAPALHPLCRWQSTPLDEAKRVRAADVVEYLESQSGRKKVGGAAVALHAACL
jgi:ankyrin repeat protein